MPREKLDQLIHNLKDEMIVLASMVETATLKAVEALKNRDSTAAHEVIDGDQVINQKRFEIENECIIIIATQQPIMATDLRTMASILEVTSEIERMGDYAKGIARVTIKYGDEPLVKPLIDIPRMADQAVNMLHRAIGAFVDGDLELARAIPKEDDIVDQLYNDVYHELVSYMLNDPTTIDRANYLMWAAHNLERLADRVTNICERTVYNRTGQLIELAGSDDEMK